VKREDERKRVLLRPDMFEGASVIDPGGQTGKHPPWRQKGFERTPPNVAAKRGSVRKNRGGGTMEGPKGLPGALEWEQGEDSGLKKKARRAELKKGLAINQAKTRGKNQKGGLNVETKVIGDTRTREPMATGGKGRPLKDCKYGIP